jgi:hypothetical protein
LNDGAGSFTDVSATHLPALLGDTAALALGDVDEDGDLDALLGSSGVQNGTGVNNHLLLNDGTGIFTDTAGLPALLEDTRAVALGDLDGDGDVDAFAGSRGNQDRIYTNLSRQLAWRGVPRVGKPVTLDIWGPESGTWVLGASMAIDGMVRFDMPRADPMRSFVVGRGDLDAQGHASITFSVPQNPNLLGTSVSWQALVGPPLRWTNLEITTLTNL